MFTNLPVEEERKRERFLAGLGMALVVSQGGVFMQLRREDLPVLARKALSEGPAFCGERIVAIVATYVVD